MIDGDGSATGRSEAQIVGSHEPWWNFNNGCTYEPNWRAHVCPRGNHDVACLAVNVPGLIDFRSSTSMFGFDSVASQVVRIKNIFDTGLSVSFQAGLSSLFALPSGVSRFNKTTVVTRTPMITGVSNVGWHIALNSGAPRTMRVATFQIPYGHNVLFATNYPPGTTFQITVSRRDNGNSSPISQVSSMSALTSSSGNAYNFSAPHLFIKMVDRTRTGSSSEYWERHGVRLHSINTDNFYNIQASCADSGTGFCSVSSAVPNF